MSFDDRQHEIVELVGELEALPAHDNPNDALLGKFITTWGNGTWPAELDYLRATTVAANTTPGPILECGSGLTTILAGTIAKKREVAVHSLEHMDKWADRMGMITYLAGLTNVQVHHAPLRSYGEYDWYTVPEDLPDNFSLVLCDGPPGRDTRGGRVGLLPSMRKALSGAVILLDDYDRPGEQAAAKEWEENWGVVMQTSPSETRVFGEGIVPQD